MQHQWIEAQRPAGPLPDALEALVPEPRRGGPSVDRLRSIVSACHRTLAALTDLVGTERALELTRTHPLNGDLYEAMAAGPART